MNFIRFFSTKINYPMSRRQFLLKGYRKLFALVIAVTGFFHAMKSEFSVYLFNLVIGLDFLYPCNQGTLSHCDNKIIVKNKYGRSFALNPTGHVIWNLCDENHNITEIIENLSSSYQLTEIDVKTDVIQFLVDLKKKDLMCYV